MEPVHGQIGLREVFFDGSNKAAGHVADNFKYSVGMAALADNMFPEELNSLLTLAFGGEDHRTVFTV